MEVKTKEAFVVFHLKPCQTSVLLRMCLDFQMFCSGINLAVMVVLLLIKQN